MFNQTEYNQSSIYYDSSQVLWKSFSTYSDGGTGRWLKLWQLEITISLYLIWWIKLSRNILLNFKGPLADVQVSDYLILSNEHLCHGWLSFLYFGIMRPTGRKDAEFKVFKSVALQNLNFSHSVYAFSI